MCSLYFASKVVLNNHIIIHAHEKEKVPMIMNIRTRPVCSAAKRQRELMAKIAQDENGPEDAEWIVEEDLNFDVIQVDSA